jgi:ketosteroid isomerase-like protein
MSRTDVVLGWYRSFNSGDIDAVVDIAHPDAVLVPPPTSVEPAPVQGVEALRAYLSPTIFESQSAEPLELIEEGDRIMVVARVRARGRGSGVELDQTAFHILTFEGGKVVRFEVHVDREPALDALRRAPT